MSEDVNQHVQFPTKRLEDTSPSSTHEYKSTSGRPKWPRLRFFPRCVINSHLKPRLRTGVAFFASRSLQRMLRVREERKPDKHPILTSHHREGGVKFEYDDWKLRTGALRWPNENRYPGRFGGIPARGMPLGHPNLVALDLKVLLLLRDYKSWRN